MKKTLLLMPAPDQHHACAPCYCHSKASAACLPCKAAEVQAGTLQPLTFTLSGSR